MKKLNFSYNWNNKLHCKYFTTLRLRQGKYQVGDQYEIMLKDKFMGIGEIMAIKHLYINDINEYIAGLDTGYPVEDTIKIIRTMYKKVDLSVQQLSLILIRKIKMKETQGELKV